MSGFEIFIGGVLVCNAILAGYLVGSSKRIKDLPTDNQIPEPENQRTEASESSENTSVSATSGFDVDKFITELGEKFIAEIPRILAGSIGEIPVNEVEFADEQSESPSGLNSGKEVDKTARMEDEAALKAIETDYRDIDDFPPSEPISSGASIDELEDAVETSLNDEATEEEKIKAGRILQEYKHSQLFDSITANERIGKRVDFCVKLAIRAQISSPKDNAKGKNQQPLTSKAENKKTTLQQTSKGKKSEPFNPEAYLNGYQS